jgi:hypothetical protein
VVRREVVYWVAVRNGGSGGCVVRREVVCWVAVGTRHWGRWGRRSWGRRSWKSGDGCSGRSSHMGGVPDRCRTVRGGGNSVVTGGEHVTQ